jgi:hypothetical protein
MGRLEGVSKDFWGMWLLFMLFIVFAAGMTYWGGFVEYAFFWLISGVVGTVVMAYFFRRDASREG